MIQYQVKVVARQYKDDEFVSFLNTISQEFRKEKGCDGFELYRDMEKENAFAIVGVWKNRKAMEEHFQRRNYKALLGAAKVLGESYEMKIAALLDKNGLELVRDLSSRTKEQKPDNLEGG